jgi:hypothetical protein
LQNIILSFSCSLVVFFTCSASSHSVSAMSHILRSASAHVGLCPNPPCTFFLKFLLKRFHKLISRDIYYTGTFLFQHLYFCCSF